MLIEPKIRGFLCTTAHPLGCEAAVKQQIQVIRSKGPIAGGPKNALIIGATTGYGLSSRIAAAFGSQANTLGIGYERPAERGRTASPGWYQTQAVDKLAKAEGLYAESINGDAFTNELREQALAAIKANMGPIDLFIYSLAAPRRVHPFTGVLHKSVLKTIVAPHTGKTVDFNTGKITEVTLEPASPEEIADTIAVMGGDDWSIWTEALLSAGLLAKNAVNVAYSYYGPVITQDIYRRGTIGSAKDDLEKTASRLQASMAGLGGKAYVSINKALVTQASSAIPYMPLYINLLYTVMEELGVHEGCVEQIDRLFRERLYTGGAIPLDPEGRIRIDELELRADVQAEVQRRGNLGSTDNLAELGNNDRYRQEFLRLYGFGWEGVDYTADTPEDRI
jgi:enoyl-[acyl-carrier protein] reductase/trans-2-enoyl-CoA reductase (NAD+)